MANGAALVLFSGGQDSTVCLAWALERYDRVETVGYAYGQRHEIELVQRQPIRAALAAMRSSWQQGLGEDHVLELSTLGQISETSLTRDVAFGMTKAGLPNTFVPGRNLLFFTYAAALAYRRDINVLVGGMCQTDFSGYPDCRYDALQMLGTALALGMDVPVAIETPLMWIDKAATWALAHKLGGDPLVQLIVEATHTCYLGDRTTRHVWGAGCGTCPACDLRANGWDAWHKARN